MSRTTGARGVALALLAVLASCRDGTGVARAAAEETSTPSAGAGVHLVGGGSTFVFPAMRRWVAEHPERAGVAVTYQAIGSGTGVSRILERTLDFGASDAALSDVELAQARGRLLHIPIALGAVTVAYNVGELAGQLRLDRDTIVGIFLGAITKWNDRRIAATNPGVSLPAQDIVVVHRGDPSGTTAVFTRYLSDASETWRSKYGDEWVVAFPVGISARGNEGVASLVRRTPGAISYVELSTAKLAGLAYARVENPARELIEPTVGSIEAAAAAVTSNIPDDLRVSIVDAPGATAYPIAAFTFALVYEQGSDATRDRALARFLWWVIHDGQRIGRELSYAALPGQIVERVERKLDPLLATH